MKKKKVKSKNKKTKVQEIKIKKIDFLIKGRSGYLPNEDLFARHLITKYDFKTIYGKKSDELYMFDGQIYRTEKAREVIKTECENTFLKYCKTRNVTEIIEKIKRLTATDRKIFDEIPLNLIPLNNGIFDLNQNKLIHNSNKIPFRYNFPLFYDSKAKCETFLKFLDEMVSPDDINVIQEWFGFTLYRSYFEKKGMILRGEKDTGKTILLNVLISFLGENNISGISLQRIANEDKFALSALYSKHANVYDDLSSKDLNNTGGFKIATGGGWITGEYKFGDSFQFKNFAKLIFACNKIPNLKDIEDDAYIFRWMPIEFVNVIPPEEQDKFLINKLTTKEELSGILNWALEGLQRLIKNGKFSYKKSEEEIKRIMDSGDILKNFIADCLVECNDKSISKEDMFNLFLLWVKQTNSASLTKVQVSRNLYKKVKFIIPKHDDERFWDNVKLNEESPFFKKLKEENTDTFDTFKKTIRDICNKDKKDSKINEKNEVLQCNDIISGKVSKVSDDADTSDTLFKKDEDLEDCPE